MQRLSKCSWGDVRTHIQAISPQLTEIIDRLSPDDSFSLYEASYPFGAIIRDEKRVYYPLNNGTCSTLDALPKEYVADLSYAGTGIPMGMVLNNSIELFIENFGVFIPNKLQLPGSFFGLIHEKGNEQGAYTPYGLLKMTAGARSLFMLPNIGDTSRYAHLQRAHKLKTKQPPRELSEHGTVFKEIYTAQATAETDWSATLLYFSGKWAEKMQHDSHWKELKLYLLEEEWRKNIYRINNDFLQLIFSLTQAKKNLRPNPYLADTTRYLLSMAVGSSPGFVPASNELAAPIKILQKAFLENYGLKHAPVIMHLGYLDALNPQGYEHIYYGLHYPLTMAFSPKSRQDARTVIELRELKDITTKLFYDIMKSTSICNNTLASNVLNLIEVDFFHNKIDLFEEILLSTEMPARDPILSKNLVNDTIMPFADSAAFVRGCVQLSKKNMFNKKIV